MQRPFDEETYRVSDLCAEIKLFVGEAFPSVWVRGEVQRIHRSRAGHLYFELIDKGDSDHLEGRLDGVIWRGDLARIERQLASVGVELSENAELRVLGRLDLYPPQGRLQFIIRQVDPSFSLGKVEQLRRQTLHDLAAQGLIDQNRELALPEVPLKVALVASVESAGYHDFLATLAESGWGFQIARFDAVVQGEHAPASIEQAIGLAAGTDADVVVVVRGGGAKSDLYAFDTLPVAAAIAGCSKPVLVGLGHQIDLSVSDRVANTSLKTPTRAASFLVEQMNERAVQVRSLAVRISTIASKRINTEARLLSRQGFRISRGLQRITGAESSLQRIAGRLRSTSEHRISMEHYRLQQIVGRVPAASMRRVDAGVSLASVVEQRIVSQAQLRTRAAHRQLTSYARLASELAPERLLIRGFSITRDSAGRVVRSTKDVTVGDTVLTKLAEGALRSTIDSMENDDGR